jgi:DNA helicase-2/ATP-dependent DNA helicase PcrA
VPDANLNPAEQAAASALATIQSCIEAKDNFLLEAGAGAGKTYSLVNSLQFLIKSRGSEFIHRSQRIACITYTNVATKEIETRTDGHPAIMSSTIHSFCWSLIKSFQAALREEIPNLPNWHERIDEAGGIGKQRISYDLGYPKIEEHDVWLHHNDVIALTTKLLENEKFRRILTGRYPVLFIDEYQDTEADFADALKKHFLSRKEGPLLGFFGDHWQRIYGTGCGKIEHPNLKPIGKQANFRSVPAIVNCLNRMRPELPQHVTNPDAQGIVAIYHTNAVNAERRSGQHWEGDLPAEVAHQVLHNLLENLKNEGWDFNPKDAKVLMLTHNVLAAEQGYRNLADVFPRTESYIKREDPYMAFFVDFLEPLCAAFENKHFGEMFALLGNKSPGIRTHDDKLQWSNDMKTLMLLRTNGTVGAVLDHLKQSKHPRLPESIERKEKGLEQEPSGDTSEGEKRSIERVRNLRGISYLEVIALAKFLNEQTPFSTKHGVKGAEFENVLVVVGRGWNQYNFGQFLEWAGPDGCPADKRDAYERNRNLFYVTCSRAKRRLAVLFTQELSSKALATIVGWFGADNIRSIGA